MGKATAAHQSWPAIVDRPEIYGLDANFDNPIMHDDGFSICRSGESGVASFVHFVNGCSRQFVDIWFPSGGQSRLVPLRVSVQVIECSGRCSSPNGGLVWFTVASGGEICCWVC